MKVAIVGRDAKNIAGLVKKVGFETVDQNPDVVISFGGDGTLLSAERQFPNVPKLPIRNSAICNKCTNHADETVLEKLKEGKLQLKEYKKLETEILYKKFYALNDFVIRNSDPTHTIRFKASVTSQLLIGDGIVISTPFGSSGYFKSITHQTFEKGIGVAFNNTTEKMDPVYLKDEKPITFKLIRGKAVLAFDNSADIFTIDEGSELTSKLSDQVARIYEDTSLRCPDCKIIRD